MYILTISLLCIISAMLCVLLGCKQIYMLIVNIEYLYIGYYVYVYCILTAIELLMILCWSHKLPKVRVGRYFDVFYSTGTMKIIGKCWKLKKLRDSTRK